MTNESHSNRGHQGHAGGNRGGYGKPAGAGKGGYGNKGGYKGNRDGGKKPYGNREGGEGRKGGYGQKSGGYKGGSNFKGNGGYKGDCRDNRGGEGYKGDRRNDRRDNRNGEGYKGERKFDGNRGGERSFDRNGKKPYGTKGGFDKKPYGSREGGEGRGSSRSLDRGGYKGERRDGERGGYKRDDRRFDRRDGRGGDNRRDNRGGKPGYKGNRKFDNNRGGKPYGERKDGDFKKRDFAAEEREGAVAENAAEGVVGGAGETAPQGEGRTFERREGEDRGPRRDAREGGRPAGRGGFGNKPRSGGRRFQVKLSQGRAAACEIGRIVRERNAFTAEVTPAVLAKFKGISPEDAAFATKISRGVTATLGTMDEFINRNLRSPEDIEPNVRDAMRVSAYELLFLNKASYAAVDQGVELVRSIEPKAAGLANSVLRKMADNARAFPFGNPNLSLQVLARSEAFPLWIAKRLMNEMGLQQATAFMHACNADAPVYAAVNAIKATDEEVEEVFDQAGSLLEKNPDVPGCFLIKDARVLRKPEVRALFEQGKVCISDASAQAIALLACPDQAPASVLEIGCGRGTKTILMQSDAQRKYGHTLNMTSVDDHDFKTELALKRAELYGISTVKTLTANAAHISEQLEAGSFDAVFVDAPCSGLGTLRRHPEIRWRLTSEDVTNVASVASDLLFEAAQMVKPGGTLTYATCTVFNEENDELVSRFLRTKFGENFSKEAEISTSLTSTGPDAHYAVRLRRAQ